MEYQSGKNKVIIVGAGLSGICMGIALKKQGIDFVILEKNPSVGGTWFENQYPGSGCDIPMFAYCYSFEQFKGNEWPKQPEILEYFKHCVEKYEIEKHICFDALVDNAKFVDNKAHWQVTLQDGRQFDAKFLVSATGQLNIPYTPKFAGMEAFKKPILHSARWQSDIEIKDKVIGIIGNGATTLQLVEALQPVCKKVHVFARSAKYIYPRVKYSPLTMEKMRNDEEFWLKSREQFSDSQDQYHAFLNQFPKLDPFDSNSEVKQFYAQSSTSGWEQYDEFYRWLEARNLRPNYPTGCSRPLASNTYHEAIRADNVELVTQGIDRFSETGIISGEEQHELDLVIMATGFDLQNLVPPYDIIGANNKLLKESWSVSPNSFLGIAAQSYPNLFFLYGPNTNTNATSVTFYVESQVNYIMQILAEEKSLGFTRIEVKPEAVNRFADLVRTKSAEVSESAECSSWYKNNDNINISTFPGRFAEYQELTKHVDLNDYVIQMPAADKKPVLAKESIEKVKLQVIHIFANTTGLQKREVDADRALREYPLDSMLITEFIKQINKHFDLSLAPVVLFEYLTLGKFGKFIAHETISEQPHIQEEEPVAPKPRPSNVPMLSSKQMNMLKNVSKELTSDKDPKVLNKSAGYKDDAIAIIGATGYFPQADSTQALWDNLVSNQLCITEVPKERWDWQQCAQGHDDIGETRTKWGGFVNGVDLFDPLFFKISPTEAEWIDPQHRLFLQSCWEVIEQAGYNPYALSDSKVGIILGINLNDYSELIQQENSDLNSLQMSGLMHLFGANRVSYLFGFTGPSEVIDTACSSSLVAVHRGIQSLKQDNCDLVIAGGANLMLSPKMHLLYAKAGMLAEDGRCKTFSDQANGYVRGEGVAVVLMKKLAEAKADGDVILGVVKGSAENHGGKANSLTAPNPTSQAKLVYEAMAESGFDPRTIGYIECHGTGTALGDPIEFNGLTKAFENRYKDIDENINHGYCGLGSIKSNIGHLETAAGVAGLIKVLMCMKHQMLPATLLEGNVNEQIKLEQSPFYIVDENQPWDRMTLDGVTYPRRAGVSSFGAGGTNAHVIVEEYIHDHHNLDGVSTGQPNLFILSAHTQEQLQTKATDFYDELHSRADSLSDGSLEATYRLTSIAFTLQVGREEMDFRLAIVADSYEQLCQRLKQYIEQPQADEQIFAGQASKHNEFSLIFNGDEELQRTVGGWLAARRLSKLAELWVKNVKLDWQRLYKGMSLQRVKLPSYPFSKQRYWFEGESRSRWIGKPVKGALLPMIHTNVSDFTRQAYSVDLNGTEFFTRDHRVRLEKGGIESVKVLPAVAYMEMVIEAYVLANGGQPESTLEFSQVAWIRPLIVSEKKTLTVSFEYDEYDECNFSIYSVKDGQETLHCLGKLFTEEPFTVQDVPLNSLKTVTNGYELDKEQIYQGLDGLGLDYGPSHRSLDYLWRGEQSVLAQVSVPTLFELNQESYFLHPSLLDGVLQACNSLVNDLRGNGTYPYLPIAVDSMSILMPCKGKMYAQVRHLSDVENMSGVEKMDIDICNEVGKVAITIRGLSIKEARAFSAQKGEGNFFAEPIWVAEPAKAREHTATLQQHVLVCGDIISAEELSAQLGHAQVAHLPLHATELASDYETLVLRCLQQLQAIWPHSTSEGVMFQVVIGNDVNASWRAGIAGLLQSAMRENPRLNAQVVLVDTQTSATQLGHYLTDELHNYAFSPLVRYKNTQRQVRHWLETVPQNNQPSSPFKEGGCYLITGGTGGLGLVFAAWIASQVKDVRLILTGRKPLDGTIEEKLATLPCAPEQVHYAQVDLSNLTALRTSLTEVQRKTGPLNGILHMAGMLDDGLLINKSASTCAQVLAPKVTGTVNLSYATADIPLDFMVLFSSLASWAGNAGQADYAAANGFQDGFAAWRNGQVESGACHGKTMAINWPLWARGGMSMTEEQQSVFAQEMGLSVLTDETGLHLFHHCMAMTGEQIIALSGERNKLPDALACAPGLVPHAAPVIADTPTEPVVAADMQTRAQAYFCGQFARWLKLPETEVDADADFERYGIDSILSMTLTRELEKEFGTLSKTLFFEYQTIAQLSAYFVQAHQAKLSTLLGEENPQAAAVPASPTSIPTRVAPVATERPRAAAPTRLRRRLPSGAADRPATETKKEPIAIIGLSGRYPQSRDLAQYWQNLAQGRDCIEEIPASRWAWQDYYTMQRTEPGHHYSKWGGFIEGVDEFDPRFFNISPREAIILDPQERLFLTHAWQAMEDAGYTRQTLRGASAPDGYEGQVGVYVGVMYSEYQLLGVEASLQGQRMGIASSVASIANRVSYVLNLHGPSMTLDTMCSSSLTAIHLACQDLREGRTGFALAGGVNVSIHPNKYLMLSAGQFVSSEGRCESFGEGGDGYVPGEGVGVALLRRLSDAEAAGDHIYGVILGSALNHGGKTHGFTVPNPQAQSQVSELALAQSGVSARHISYVEAHGTGTKLGDPIEVTALTKTFGMSTTEQGYCWLGSAKSNIGHCEAAAGIAGLSKVLLQMKHGQIAPSLHSATLNPHIDFEQTPFEVNQQLRAWERPEIDGKVIPRIAGLSSFGAGGSNAHMVIAEYQDNRADMARPSHNVAIVLSARTETQLIQKAASLAEYLTSETDVDMAALAYTLQMGREAMAYRLAMSTDSVSMLLSQLQAVVAGETEIDGVYQGHTDEGRGTLGMFGSDTSLQATVAQWMAQTQWGKLLPLWVKGLPLSWSQLYQGVQTKKLPLPTYPFAKERYWVEAASAASESETSTHLHPMLHRNCSTLAQIGYQSDFNGREGYFLEATGTLPVMGYVMMARAALADALGVIPHTHTVTLESVAFGVPYASAQHGSLCIALLPKEQGLVAFEIYSQDQTGAEQIHCQGYGYLSEAPMLAVVETAGMTELRLAQSGNGLEVAPQLLEQALQQLSGVAGAWQTHRIGGVNIYGPCTEQMYIQQVSYDQTRMDVQVYNAHGELCAQLQEVEGGVAYAEQGTESAGVEQTQTRTPTSEHTAVAQAVQFSSGAQTGVGIQRKPVIPALAKMPVTEFAVSAQHKPTNIQLLTPMNMALSGHTAARVQWSQQENGVATLQIAPLQDNDVQAQGAALLRALEAAQQRSDMQVLVLQGLGNDYLGDDGQKQAWFEPVSQLLAHFPCPVIAVMPHKSVGSTLLLGALCDFMVLARDGEYGYVQPDAAMFASGAETVLFVARFGLHQASHLLYSTQPLSGLAWQQLGFSGLVSSSAKIAADAQALAKRLAQAPHKAVRLLKAHLAQSTQPSAQIAPMYCDVQAVATSRLEPVGSGITVSEPHAGVWAVNIDAQETVSAQESVAALNALLAQSHPDNGCHAVVLSSDHDAFIPHSADEWDIWAPLLDGVRNTAVPVVCVLKQGSEGASWVLGMSCDTCFYDTQQRYGLQALQGENAWLATATGLFNIRLGAVLGQEVLLSGRHYRGDELQHRAGQLNVHDSDTLLSQAIAYATRYSHVAGESLLAVTRSLRAEVEAQRSQLPAWREVSDASHSDEVTVDSDVLALSTHEGGVLEVCLQDKAQHNMLSDALVAGLESVFAQVAKTSAYKVVVLSAAGNYFCAGGTKETLESIHQGTEQFTDRKVFELAMTCPLPVISAMAGHGLGAGWVLGLHADIAIMSEQSHYVSPYMGYGFTPGAGATYVLPTMLGMDLGRESLMGAQSMTGAALKQRSVPHRVLPKEEVRAAALHIAADVARQPRSTLMAQKRLWAAGRIAACQATYDAELRMHDETFVGSDNTLSRIQQHFANAPQTVLTARVEPVQAPAPVDVDSKLDVGDVQATLRALLANELYMSESDIAPDSEFVDLGLDSITGVTWVRKFNEVYQTNIDAIQIYSYPTLKQLSDYVAKEASVVATTEMAQTETVKSASVVDSSAVAHTALPASTVQNTAIASTDVQATLRTLLANELYMSESDIAPDSEFVDLGLDSITGVTWVRKFNEVYQTNIDAIQIYSYPTLKQLSDYVAKEAGVVATTEMAQTETVKSASVVDSSAVAHTALPASTAQNTTIASTDVQATLRTLLANELYMSESDIAPDSEFVDLGLDSITGVTWVRKFNEVYQTNIDAIQIYSYPTLKQLSDYVAKEAGVVQPAAPVVQQVVATPPSGAPRSAASTAAPSPIETTALRSVTLTSWRQSEQSVSHTGMKRPEPVAIIGMAGQFAMASDLSEFWQNIAQGKDCISEVSSRWDVARYYSAQDVEPGKTNSKWLGAMSGYDQFDPLFFNISPTEAQSMDPQQRLFLQSCWHAIEHAGYQADSLSGSRCGVFVGVASSDYHSLAGAQAHSARSFIGGATSILAARIAYFLNLQGPCWAVDTACSSSLVALANACDSLNARNSDLALAGGVYVMAGEGLHLKTAQSGMLSAQGRCFTFDQRANGFVPGEGVGAVLLKRLKDAEQAGDNIHGVITGWGVNQDGKTNGITAPSAQSQTRLEREVYDRHGISVEGLQLIEAHGTGTALGDPIEVEGLKAAFKGRTEKTGYCALGSVKSNIGHCLTAAGIAGVLKLVMALKHRQLPPTLHVESQNEHIKLAQSPFYLNTELQSWEVAAGERRQGAVSSFGFSGTNAHIVIAEHPARAEQAAQGSEDGQAMIVLSARTEQALQAQVENLRDYLVSDASERVRLRDIAYTLQVGRVAMEKRLGLVAQSKAALQEQLTRYLAGETVTGLQQGELKPNQEGLSIISDEAELQTALLTKWVSTEQWHKLLNLWVKGVSLDWTQVYGQEVMKRVELPLYPFAQERYWWSEAEQTTPEATHTVVTQVEQQLHPLVHHNVSTMFEQSYQSTFTGTEFYLADHQVNGQKILPGVAYLEMVIASLNRAMKMPAQFSGWQLSNVVWSRPIAVAEQHASTVNILLEPLSDGQFGFKVVTDAQSEDNEVLNCSARAVLVENDTQPSHSLTDIQRRLTKRQTQGQQNYALFDSMHLNYGESFRGLSEILVGEGEVLAEVILPKVVATTHDEFLLHPTLLDSAIQASIELYDTKPQDPMVPFALESLEVFKLCPSKLWAWARFSKTDKPGDVRKLDIDLLDEHGKVCVRLNGLTTRVSAPVTVEPENMIYVPAWQEVQFEKNSAVQPSTVIFAGFDTSFDVEQVQVRLADAHLIQIPSSEEFSPSSYEACTLAIFNNLQKLLAEQHNRASLVQIVIPNDSNTPLLEGVSAMLKTAQAEFSKLRVQVIVVDRTLAHEPLCDLIQECNQDTTLAIIKHSDARTYTHKFIEQAKPKDMAMNVWRENGTYLITGGLGGLGLMFAQAIAHNTASSKIALVGRSVDPNNAETARKLEQLSNLGAQVKCYKADVTDERSLSRALQSIEQEMGALTGILHCAGINKDNYILKKSDDEFKTVLAAKVHGTTRLHELTKAQQLDFFVTFSSVASSLGNAGQIDYAAANGFMDSFASYRNQQVELGQCYGKTVSINWPLMANGGIVLEAADVKLMETQTGLRTMPEQTALEMFTYALSMEQSQVMVLTGKKQKIEQTFFAKKPVANKVHAPENDVVVTTQVQQISEQEQAEALLNAVEAQLLSHLSSLLSIDEEELDVDIKLSDYGMDSISFSELANLLNNEFGISISPTIFFEYQTISEIVSHLVEDNGDVLSTKFKLDTGTQNTVDEVTLAAAQSTLVSDVAPTKLPNMEQFRIEKSQRFEAAQPVAVPNDTAPSQVAVIGISGKFPGANNLDEFWENLQSGVTSISQVPATRWDWQAIYGDPRTEKNKTNIKWGGFVDRIDCFDPLFFGISPTEAKVMDPQQRLMMMFIWSVIEDAGYSADSLAGTNTGIFVGTSNSGYSDILNQASVGIEGYSSTGLVPSIGPNRMSYLLDLHGPSEPIETACSSSLVAIHRAVEAIKSGSCSAAIAGGVNIIVTPWAHIAFSKAGMLCEDGVCKTFSENANGYVRGEGMGMLFLKRLDEAQRDGDSIYAVIKASAENHGGQANTLTSPNPKAQAKLLLKAYEDAGVEPNTIGYIEAHGTGTQLGDPIEINALKNAFKSLYERAGLSKPQSPHCALGSVKSNIGHLELAAGVAGVIKVILQLKNKKLVKTLHCEQVNPQIQLADSPFYLQTQTQDWPAIYDANGQTLPRRAGVSSFGFGGVNAHVVLEEYQATSVANEQGSEPVEQLIVLSAKNKARLLDRADSLLSYLHKVGQADQALLQRIAHTLQVGRVAMDARAAFVCNSVEQLAEQLQMFIDDNVDNVSTFANSGKLQKDLQGQFDTNSERQAELTRWIAQLNLQKLAQLWVSGVAFDWSSLHTKDETIERINLPSYPFAEDRYWIEQAYGNLYSDEQPRNAEQGLLHENVSTLAEQQYLTQLSKVPMWLRKSTTLSNESSFSPIAYLELACSALKKGVPTGLNEEVGIQLSGINWAQTSPSCQADDLITHIYKGDHDNQICFESRVRDLANLECSGRASYLPYASMGSLDTFAFESKQRAEISVHEVLEALGNNHIYVNDAKQRVDSISYQDDKLLIKVKPQLVEHSLDNGHDLPLSLLDLCLKVYAQVLKLNGQLHVPRIDVESMESLLINSSKEQVTYISVETQAHQQSQVKITIKMANSQGNTLLEARQLTLCEPQVNINTALASTEKAWLAVTPQWTPVQPDRSHIDWAKQISQKASSQFIVLCDDDVFTSHWEATLQHISSITGGNTQFDKICRVTFADVLSGDKERRLIELLHSSNDDIMMLALVPHTHQNSSRYIKQLYQYMQLLMQHAPARNVQAYCLHCVQNTINDVYNQALSGLFKSAMMENPAHRYRSVELSQTATQDYAWIQRNVLQEWLCDDSTLAPAAVTMLKYIDETRYEAQLQMQEKMQLSGVSSVLARNKNYLMVGALGAAGKEVCCQLGRQYGANLIIFSSRAQEEAFSALEEIKASGAKVTYYCVDILNEAQVKQQVQEITGAGIVLHGVIHMARSSSNEAIVHKSADQFMQIGSTKLQGTINIDDATQNHPLEFFIMYSSMASFGIKGASDYAYSTAFQNQYAMYRTTLVEQGKRAGRSLSICWGQWNVDGAVEQKYMAARLEQFAQAGVDVINAKDALDVMNLALAVETPVTGFTPVIDKTKVLVSLGIETAQPSIVVNEIQAMIAKFDQQQISRETFSEYLCDLDPEEISEDIENGILAAIERYEQRSSGVSVNVPETAVQPQQAHVETHSGGDAITETVALYIEKVLGVNSGEVDLDTPFQDYGLNSITAVQITAQLEKEFCIPIPPNWLVEYANIAQLANKISEQVEPSEHTAAKTAQSHSSSSNIKHYEDVISERIIKVLGVDKSLIDLDTPFQSYGLDSITAVQITTLLERDFDIQVAPSWLIENANISSLANRIYDAKKQPEVA